MNTTALILRLRDLPYMQQAIYLRDLLRELTVRDMKVKYMDSVLGIAWSLMAPLLQLLVYNFMFSLVLNLNIPNYASFAYSGMLAWTWFQASLFEAAGAITSSRELIRQPAFPVAVLPAVTVTTNLIHFLLALPILICILTASSTTPGLAILTLPIVMAVQFVLTLSLAYLVAAANVIFRDTQHLLGVLLQLLFFLTPVFYDASAVPASYQLLYRLNPMVHLVDAYRAILLHGTAPNWGSLLVLSGLAAGILYVSLRLFKRVSYRFVEEL